MNDYSAAICQLVGRAAVLRKDWIGATNPWADSYINPSNYQQSQNQARIAGAQPAANPGNPQVTSEYMSEGQRQMTAYSAGLGGWSNAQFARRLQTSTQRTPATVTAAPTDAPSGFGGSGSTGNMPEQLGAPAAHGTEVTAAPTAPSSPQATPQSPRNTP